MNPVSPTATAAIVGAGVSGSMCAHRLAEDGFAVTVFAKARGPGGRTATRHIGPLSVDHGAQYFTTRDPVFRGFVDRWLEAGVAAQWSQPLARVSGSTTSLLAVGERYVGVPGMSALARDLLQRCTCRYETTVTAARRLADGWRVDLSDGSEAGPFDVVIVAIPPAQALDVFGDASPLAEYARDVKMVPCWATVLALRSPLDVVFDGAFVDGDYLSWISRDSGKPGREGERDVWVLHATAEWSQANLEAAPEAVWQALSQTFQSAVGTENLSPEHVLTHRWLYARPERSDGRGSLLDVSAGIGLCGDWLADGRVEPAALSGLDLANRIISGVGS